MSEPKAPSEPTNHELLCAALLHVSDAHADVVEHEAKARTAVERLHSARGALSAAQERVDELMLAMRRLAPSNTTWSRGRLPE